MGFEDFFQRIEEEQGSGRVTWDVKPGDIGNGSQGFFPEMDSVFGRMPLTTEQTRRGYARMFQVDERYVDPEMKLQFLSEGTEGTTDGQGAYLDRDNSAFGSLSAPQSEAKRTATEPGMGVRENGQGPMNEPYDPESPAVRGRDGVPLPPDLREEMRKYLPGDQFKNMDLESLQIHTEHAPWFMPSDRPAMTLENHIYVRPEQFPGGYFDPQGRMKDREILLEEVAHAMQFQNGMTRPGYLWEAVLKGYDHNKYETDAKDIANQITHPQRLESRDLYE